MTGNHIPVSETVAISVSESPDMEVLGLNQEHLKDATCKIALHMLSHGLNLVYGGDLRLNGFTEVLFELVDRYHSDTNTNPESCVTNYLAWPVHIGMNVTIQVPDYYHEWSWLNLYDQTS